GSLAPAELDRWLEAVVAETDERRLAAALLAGAIALARADRGYVLAYEAGRLRGAVTQGMDYAAEVQAGFSETIAARALYEARPIYVVDAASDAEFREAASVVALDLHTVVALPLLAGDEVLGVLYMDRAALEPSFGPPDLALLMAYARTGAGLLAAARARHAAETEMARWRACAGLGARLAGVADAAAARRIVLAAVSDVLGATRAHWLVQAGAGWTALDAPAEDISAGVASWVHERGEPLVLVDAGSDEAWQAHASVQALGLSTVWCLPAGSDVLYLDAPRAAGDRDELRLAAALAAWAAPVVAGLAQG
ncbi:MAG: two component, sigma54 specific, transcriptional regulator, Fis family, partial [Cyanobacteria bacterium RYN_339]|nr:two component, sigma54 specific, transcriptional regulator, Fis family [Cyanobacteria bacterium RYN_339]